MSLLPSSIGTLGGHAKLCVRKKNKFTNSPNKIFTNFCNNLNWCTKLPLLGFFFFFSLALCCLLIFSKPVTLLNEQSKFHDPLITSFSIDISFEISVWFVESKFVNFTFPHILITLLAIKYRSYVLMNNHHCNLES